jgi:hypothetical protein
MCLYSRIYRYSLREIIYIVFILFSFQSFSQNITRSVLGSLNDVQTSNTAILHSSFGQSSISGTLTSTNGMLCQGFQQPISDLATIIQDYYNSDVELNVYPNPFIDFTNISIISNNLEGYTLTLRTISGNMVWQRKNINAETKLPKGKLHPAVYILELKKNKEIQYKNIVIQ